MQTTRDIYLDACAQIGSALAGHGFKYAKSGPHAKQSHGDFSFGIHFQSSVYNSAGSNIALWIYANVRSKRLSSWRSTQPHSLRTDDWAAGGQLGNLMPAHRWLDINLADAISRPVAISNAIRAIEAFGLPFFSAFEDVPALCERLVVEDMLGMEVPLALEFLLCFSTEAAATALLKRFFTARADLFPQYREELDRFRSEGLPRMPRTGYAVQLAFATVAYGLAPVTDS